MVEKMQEDLIASFIAVKRKKFADKVGLPESDPIRFKAIPGDVLLPLWVFLDEADKQAEEVPACADHRYWATARKPGNRQGMRPGT